MATVEIDERTEATLRKLANGASIGEVVARLAEAERRRAFFAADAAALAALKADPVAWAEHQAESGVWDATLMDGLEDEPAPDEVGVAG